MINTDKTGSLWPYLLFLPDDPKKRDDFIRSVLASRLARTVLSSFDDTGRVLQRDLIENLPHSNKSILAYLKTLSNFGLITTGTTIHNGKRVVFHELTKNGWGLARFYFKGLPSDVEELTSFLLEDYLTMLATMYREQGIPENTLFEIFARMRAKAILGGSKTYEEPTFILFGASAFNTQIDCEKIPPDGGLASCSYPIRHSGGPTVELALALAKEGYDTTLVSSVGNDMDGWNAITDLIQGNVDVRHVVVDADKQTNESIIINVGEFGSHTFVGVGPATSLSITSPSQVPWKEVENSKIVYIGEVFVEVAAAIVAHTKVQGIQTVYRCSVPFLELGLDRLKPVLSQVDTLLISTQAWWYLKKYHGLRAIVKLREVTDAAIVVHQSNKEYLLSIVGEKEQILSSKNYSSKASDSFVTRLLIELTEDVNIRQAVENAVASL
ncbi:MAG: carbohydrate kinase family protein [Candidatus Thorarchaeota archaeon]